MQPRTTALASLAIAAALVTSADASADTFPSHPVTIVVPFPAGGPTDTVARVLAEPMRVALGQPIIIENITGAAGSIGTGNVARAAPTGYTLTVGYLGTHVLNGALYKLSYDVLRDFEPIALRAIRNSLLRSKPMQSRPIRVWRQHPKFRLWTRRVCPDFTLLFGPVCGRPKAHPAT